MDDKPTYPTPEEEFVPLTVACYNERHAKCSGVSGGENPAGDWAAPECPCFCHYRAKGS